MITVKANLNIFTLYSFLNTVGYDDENNKNGMHPRRVDLRDKLLKIAENLDTESFKSYYKIYYLEEKIHLFHFNAYALSLGDDANFELVKTNYSTKLLPGLNLVLKDFYSKFGIKELWDEMAESHNIILAKYKDVSENIVNIVKGAFYEKQDSRIAVTVIPNLLESYFRNKSVLIDNDLYLLFGPYRHDGTNIESIIHEYLHLLVNPVIDKYNKEINDKSSFFNSIGKTQQITGSYNNWVAYFSESVVRALALSVYKDIANLSGEEIGINIDNLNRQGFVLSQKLLDQIAKYEKPYKIDSLISEFLKTLQE